MEEEMKIYIKSVENHKHKYIAYFNSPLGSASYALFFDNNIFGAVCFHTYLEIVKKVFKVDEVKIDISKVEIKANSIIDLINEENNIKESD